MAKDYQRVDLSRMVERPKCAVMCRTAGDAETFFYNFTEQFEKEYLYWSLNDILNVWNQYQDKTGFTLIVGDGCPESISYCDEEWFLDSGYELIEFEDLANPTEIEESEMSMSVLLV